MLTINLSELILTVINFFLLLFLMKRFLYTPLIPFMSARQARIEKGLAQERAASVALQNEELLYASMRKEVREKAQRILADAGTADEQRRVGLIAQVKAQNVCARKAAKVAELRENQKELCQLQNHQEQLASLLAESLLEHFSDVPEITLGSGLRLAMQKVKSTRGTNTAALEPVRKLAEDKRNKYADLFAQ